MSAPITRTQEQQHKNNSTFRFIKERKTPAYDISYQTYSLLESVKKRYMYHDFDSVIFISIEVM